MNQDSTNVLLVDSNQRRRNLVALALRAAGCHVQEGTGARDASRAIEAGKKKNKTWVIAIVDTSPPRSADELQAALHEAYPMIPSVLIGDRRQDSIAGRITMDRSPDLGRRLHALVETRDMVA